MDRDRTNLVLRGEGRIQCCAEATGVDHLVARDILHPGLEGRIAGDQTFRKRLRFSRSEGRIGFDGLQQRHVFPFLGEINSPARG
jgi:hypothetical protein